MMLDLSSIMNVDGKKQGFDLEFDFVGKNESGAIFLTPVSVSGRLVNIGGSLELSAVAKTCLGFECDRCCESFEEDFECSFEEVLKKEDEKADSDDKNPDAIYFRGNSIELDELVLNNVLLSLPLKRLCKETCRGLCANCGKNLNLGDCGCDTRTVDPRFEALDKFFE